jgi:dTDP-glucose 4,6-dehydratase
LAALVGVPYSYLHPQEVIDTNITGTSNVLLSAKDEGSVERIVLTSTSEVYGTAQYVPIDERHPLQPQSPYAATKIAADALGISFHRSFGLPVAVIRPFNAYGPRQSARAVIPTIITQALTQEEIKLGALSPTRDFTFVSDTVEGFIKMAESSRSIGEVINVGSGLEVSIGDLARKINSLVGRGSRIQQDDARLRPSASEVERLCADNSKAKQLLGWEPQVSLDEGLTKTIDWISKSLDLYRPGRYAV